MIYLLSSGGFSSVVREVCDRFEVAYLFPCKGHGCHCDIIGKELPNCMCVHTAEVSIECCSEPNDKFKIVEEVTCCSDENSETQQLIVIKKSGCGGLDSDESFLVQKHLGLDSEKATEKLYVYTLVNIANKMDFILIEVINKIHKVPLETLS